MVSEISPVWSRSFHIWNSSALIFYGFLRSIRPRWWIMDMIFPIMRISTRVLVRWRIWIVWSQKPKRKTSRSSWILWSIIAPIIMPGSRKRLQILKVLMAIIFTWKREKTEKSRTTGAAILAAVSGKSCPDRRIYIITMPMPKSSRI